MESTWRTHARTVIAEVIKECGRDDPSLKMKLRAAYPFGERRYFPYKVWCDEVRKTLGVRGKSKNNDLQTELF
jgi:hypothetical protein